MTRPPAVRLALLVGALCVLAGCSSGSAHPKDAATALATAAATGASATATPAISPSAPTITASAASAAASSNVASSAAVGSNGTAEAAPTVGPASSSFITNVCAAITLTDAQATVQPGIDAIGFDPDNQDPDGIFMCTIDAADQAVTVTVEPEDVAMANYQSDVAAQNVPAVPSLPGVGDVAVWTQVPNNPPDVFAHKGHVTCEVTTSNTQVLSLTYDPSVVDGGVTAASAAAYATKLGALCKDVFAAIS
jgi:hypothetical protein